MSGIQVRRLRGEAKGPGEGLVARACAGAASSAASFAGLVTVPAEDGAIAARLEGYGGGLAASRADDGRALGRSGTITCTAASLLVVLLCQAAGLAPFRGGEAALLEERLIRSGEGKVLPAVAARELNIAGHVSPRWRLVHSLYHLLLRIPRNSGVNLWYVYTVFMRSACMPVSG